MVGGLRAALQHTQRFSRVQSGLGDDFKQHRLADVMGAGAGDQNAARFEKLEGAQIDLLITLCRVVEHFAGFREGGRVQDDHLVLAVDAGEKIENIGLAELDVRDVVRAGVGLGCRQGVGGRIHGLHGLGLPGGVEREPSSGGEAIEDAAVGVAGGSQVILALVEIDAGFLSF